MNAFFISLSVVGISAQGALKKSFNGKTQGRGTLIFGSVSVLFACLFFLVSSGFKLDFNPEILPYALGFALSYGTATVAGFLAIKLGALSLTSLISSYSLIIPTLFGLIFLEERANVFFFIGFFLLLVSLFLINSKVGELKISLKWITAVIFAFLGNGICSVFQNVQQRIFQGRYKSEFMISALLSVFVALIVASLLTERPTIRLCLRKGAHLMALSGIANGTVNLLVMILATRMGASVMFPVISAGGIILSWCVSRFLYKERLTAKQNLALVFGICAVVLMNL